MQIDLNITFPRIPCYSRWIQVHCILYMCIDADNPIGIVLTLDVMDVAGEHQSDIDHHIYKVRLDTEGRTIGSEKAHSKLVCLSIYRSNPLPT
jgi:endoplasmic reticulum-Golgi intermediate compartment protein 3